MVDLLQVDHRGEGVELLEHVVRAPVLDLLRDRPLRIGRVTEHDGPRRARLGARRRELVGEECAPSVFTRVSASRIRCTQKVHFSITPFPRTVTSGLSCQLSGSGNAYCLRSSSPYRTS